MGGLCFQGACPWACLCQSQPRARRLEIKSLQKILAEEQPASSPPPSSSVTLSFFPLFFPFLFFSSLFCCKSFQTLLGQKIVDLCFWLPKRGRIMELDGLACGCSGIPARLQVLCTERAAPALLPLPAWHWRGGSHLQSFHLQTTEPSRQE